MGNPKTATIETSEGAVVVRKLVISEYSKLLEIIGGMPSFLNQVGLANKEDWSNAAAVTAAIPVLAVQALPELSKLLAFPTDQQPDFFMQLDLADILDVVDGVLEVNDYERIVGAIKKISGRVKTPNVAPAATSTIGSTAPSTS